MPDAPVSRAEWISAPAVNCQHETTRRICFNTSSGMDRLRVVERTACGAGCCIHVLCVISELLTSNDRSKCRSLRIILPPSIGYDRDQSDIVDLLTVWPLWLILCHVLHGVRNLPPI